MPKEVFFVELDAPPNFVFDFFTDMRNAVEYDPPVRRVELEEGCDLGENARFSAWVNFFGPNLIISMQITRYEPYSRIGLRGECWALLVEDEMLLSPMDNGGTLLQVTSIMHFRSVYKLLVPLVWLLNPSFVKKIRRNMQEAVKSAVSSSTP